jgi:AAA+ superfamily predicted ATPase
MADKPDNNIVLYCSNDFSYDFSISLKTRIKNKSENTDSFIANEVQIKPAKVTVIDRKEYIQIDLLFGMNSDEMNEYDKFVNAIQTDHFRSKYPNHWIVTYADLIPNASFKDAYLRLSYIENPIAVASAPEGYKAISFCSPIKTSYVAIGNGEEKPYNAIKNIVEFSLITDEEIDFIVNQVELHDQLSFDHKKEKKTKKFFDNIFSGGNKKEDSLQNSLINSLNMTEQEKQIFDPEMLSVSVGSVSPEQELEELIGLEDVKTEIKKFKSKLQYRKKQKERKIYIENAASMHMCFTGAPGTGKTTVARIITGILYNMGYVKENKCVEINGQNLKGGYTGQTAIITKLVMKSAKNKVLFIDEAYALFDDYENGFGKEAVAVILKEMEDERDNTIVIFAGYKDDMEEFLLMNDGLKSRINRYIHFKNYTCTELTEILMSSLKKKKLYITEEALGKCILAFKKAEMSERFSNGRFVRNMIEKIEYEHAYNTHNSSDTERQDTVTTEDIPDELIEELLTRSM